MSDTIIVIIILFLMILGWVYIRIDVKKQFQNKIDDDYKIDYKQGIELFKIDRNGVDYFGASYQDYQLNKKKEIEFLFVPGMVINWSNSQWEVISTPEFEFKENSSSKKYERKTNYYFVKIRYISNLTTKNTYNYGVISNIYGSKFHNSKVNIQNNFEIRNELIKSIDDFLKKSYENNDLSEIKKDLKLLKYEILNDEVEEKEIPNLVEKMKKFSQTAAPYASFLSAIIGLVQKLIR